MQLSNYIIVAAIEVYIVLLVVGVLLVFHTRKQRQLIRRLQEKLQQLILALKKLKLPPASTQVTGNTYKTHIHAQLTATRNHYAGLSPPADITGEPDPQSTPAQKAIALRYKFLQLEESAISKGDGPLKIDWDAFEKAWHELSGDAVTDASADELATCKKRIENLEKFKTLFFDMEKQWQNAKSQAEEYYQQLSAMAVNVDDQDRFVDLLEGYHRVYGEIDGGFNQGKTVLNAKLTNPEAPQVITVTRMDPKSGEEIIKLRNVAADQHRIINQLQRKLEAAVTAEAKEVVINELQQQLQRQIRFVQESETCIQLLEDELSSASEKVNKQQHLIDTANTVQQENLRIKETLYNFTQESKELVAHINSLEQENERLRTSLHKLESQPTETLYADNSDVLQTVQIELANLQGQYAELEEKYLDLRLKK